MNQEEKTYFEPYIPFIEQNETFTLGWECGQIFYEIEHTGQYKGLAHAKNIPQLQIVAKKLKCFIKTTPVPNMETEWVETYISKPTVYTCKSH
jgi:hypothetical protein